MKRNLFVWIAVGSMLWSAPAFALNPSHDNDNDANVCRPQPAPPFGVEPALPNPFENRLERYKPVPPPVTYDLKPQPQPAPSPL